MYNPTHVEQLVIIIVLEQIPSIKPVEQSAIAFSSKKVRQFKHLQAEYEEITKENSIRYFRESPNVSAYRYLLIGWLSVHS